MKYNKNNWVVIVLAIICLVIIFKACGGGETDPNDGKCDICGKKATYSDGKEEYCDKHLKDAVGWYIEQGQK